MHRNAWRELDILALSGHKDAPTFLVDLHFACASNDRLLFVMEYLPGGELSTVLEEKGKFSESEVQHYLAQLVLILGFYHCECALSLCTTQLMANRQ